MITPSEKQQHEDSYIKTPPIYIDTKKNVNHPYHDYMTPSFEYQ